MSALDRILTAKRAELARTQARLPLAALVPLAQGAPPPRDFVGALARPGVKIIAEIKRASPSRGAIWPNPRAWDPAAIACDYEAAGAACLSVLTDTVFFWGCADALVACRAATRLPVLRKEFVLEPYQVWESRWLGADAVLLIAAAVDAASLRELARLALELGMAVVLEVHAEHELPGVLDLIDTVGDRRLMVGVNQRNLSDLAIDTTRAAALRPRIPAAVRVVAESGIEEPEQVRQLVACGIDTFLIGSSLIVSGAPGTKLRELLGA